MSPQSPNDIGNLNRVIGEILGTLKAIETRQVERAEEARRADDRIDAELRNVKHDFRNFEQVVYPKMDDLARKISDQATANNELKDDIREVREKMEGVEKQVGKLQETTTEIIELKKRIVAVVVILSSVFGVLFSVVSKLWSAVGSDIPQKWFHG